VREKAAGDLRSLPPSDLIALISVERVHRGRRRSGLIAVIAIYLIIALGLLLLHNAHFTHFVGAFAGIIGAAAAFSPAHKEAAKALAEHDEVADIGPLIEALQIPERNVRTPVRRSLQRLLPRLRSSDAHLLNAGQRGVLRRSIGWPLIRRVKADDADFVMAVLKGLEQVGDESFLDTVRKLAEGHGYGMAAPVRQAAEECLPFLLQRIENDRMSQNLLRAAAPTSASSDTLLRAAGAGAGSAPAELLRATDAEAGADSRNVASRSLRHVDAEAAGAVQEQSIG
jgi:hypothetical protein